MYIPEADFEQLIRTLSEARSRALARPLYPIDRRHGFNEGMSKGFNVSRCDVEIARRINMVQKLVRNSPQFHEIGGQAQSPREARCSFRPIRARICPGLEPAGEKQAYLPRSDSLAQQADGANQNLEVSIVIVVTDKKQTQFTTRPLQLFLEFQGRRLRFSKK